MKTGLWMALLAIAWPAAAGASGINFDQGVDARSEARKLQANRDSGTLAYKDVVSAKASPPPAGSSKVTGEQPSTLPELAKFLHDHRPDEKVFYVHPNGKPSAAFVLMGDLSDGENGLQGVELMLRKGYAGIAADIAADGTVTEVDSLSWTHDEPTVARAFIAAVRARLSLDRGPSAP